MTSHRITGKTRVHFLIGSPISQVKAPGWLTERMRDADYDGMLVPLHIEKGNLASALPVLMAMPNVDSILITLPHTLLKRSGSMPVSKIVVLVTA